MSYMFLTEEYRNVYVGGYFLMGNAAYIKTTLGPIDIFTGQHTEISESAGVAPTTPLGAIRRVYNL